MLRRTGPMVTEVVEEVLNIIGITAFAFSGAVLAVRKQFDIVGMAVLATATALGGGLIRDALIGATPAAALTNPWWLLLPLLATVITFIWHPQVQRLRRGVQLFDAVGLGVFCATATGEGIGLRGDAAGCGAALGRSPASAAGRRGTSWPAPRRRCCARTPGCTRSPRGGRPRGGGSGGATLATLTIWAGSGRRGRPSCWCGYSRRASAGRPWSPACGSPTRADPPSHAATVQMSIEGVDIAGFRVEPLPGPAAEPRPAPR